MNYSVVIVAAGSSTRFGLNRSKMLYEIEEGTAVIDKSISIFERDEDCRQIIVVVNEAVREYLLEKKCNCILAEGGRTRQESVYNGLKCVDQPIVLVHDGARCFLSGQDLENLKREISDKQGALLVRSMTDTVKVSQGEFIVDTLNRDNIKRAETPQGFPTEELIRCYEKAFAEGFNATDDSSIVEKYGDIPIKWVESISDNTKITTVRDVIK